LAILGFACGCTPTFSTGESGEPSVTGCADGSREAYESGTDPDIGGCAGSFDIAGITTPASLSPQCERTAGNDGENPSGAGCSIADLCAEGWHVCASAREVGDIAKGCPAPSPGVFWATRQAEDMAGACAAQGSNNMVGCGQTGDGEPAPPNCGPLTIELRWTHCAALGWECGTTAEANSEAEVVTKRGGDAGGALCCRD
jgi:hypothetical protein